MRRSVAALSLSVLLLGTLAACSDDGGDTASPGATTADTAPGPAGGEPATGIIASDDPRAQQIVDLVEATMSEQHLQTVAFGVWVDGEEIVRGAIDAPSTLPPTAVDARVRVGQPMEAMLGTVLLQLAAEGKIDPDAPVEQYLPDLVNADRITPRMLASSTSGTPDYVPNEAFVDRVNANPFAGYSYDELLGYAQQSEPLFEPGTSWAYSHTDMASLVEVLTAASGQPLDELLATRIFEPLGMHDSAAHQDNTIAQPAFHAYTNDRGVYEDSTYWDPTWGLNGGMNASVADLGTWLQALNDGRLLDPADAEESLAPVTAGLGPMTDEAYFAYGSVVSDGWIVGNPSLDGYQGFTAQLRDPSVTIVVWSTAAPENTGDANASVGLGEQIAGIVTDTPLVMPSG